MPETSIIIRTLNEEKHLGNLLKAIAKQEYQDFEVIIVDSGSTDRTLEIARLSGASVIEIESKDFTFGYSLNTGCEMAKGKYLVFASAHVLPTDNKWLGNLVEPFKNEKIANVYGRQVGHELSKFSEKMDFKRIFGIKPIDSSLPLDYVNNANAALRRDLWKKRPFDEYLFGLEDIDWAKYITEQGYLIRYEPKAAVYHIHEEPWHQVFNRYRREAIAAAKIGLRHPPQARISTIQLIFNFLLDIVASFPNWKRYRIEEILRFRYYQWKGTRRGWFNDRDVDLETERREIFFPITNQRVVIQGRSKAALSTQAIPKMRPGDVLIKVEYVGVCRTDLEVYEGTLGYYRDGVASYPIVPGHEFSGTIVKMGANNKFRERFKAGDRVVGECILSRDGKNRKEVGVINHDGAYSQFVIIPGDHIHRIPQGINTKTAVLTEPLAVVLRGLRRIESRMKPGSEIAVIGAGPIGNLCAQALTVSGYSTTLFDKRQDRLDKIKDKLAGVSTDLSQLSRFNIIVECTGAKPVLEKLLRESRIDSTLLLLGFPYGDTLYNFEDLVGNDKVVVGSVGADNQDFEKALLLLPQIETSILTSTVLPLKEFKDAWRMQEEGKYLKLILKP